VQGVTLRSPFLGHPRVLILGGIEARRVRRRNAQAVHLRALRQNELGGIARSVAGVRDRGGGIARFGVARVRQTGAGQARREKT